MLSAIFQRHSTTWVQVRSGDSVNANSVKCRRGRHNGVQFEVFTTGISTESKFKNNFLKDAGLDKDFCLVSTPAF